MKSQCNRKAIPLLGKLGHNKHLMLEIIDGTFQSQERVQISFAVLRRVHEGRMCDMNVLNCQHRVYFFHLSLYSVSLFFFRDCTGSSVLFGVLVVD